MRAHPLPILLATVLLALACAGGGSSPLPELGAGKLNEPAWVADQATLKRDEFRQTTTLRGPDIERDLAQKGDYARSHLRGTSASNGAERFHVYVAARLSGGFHDLSTARDQEGIAFPVAKLSRKEHCSEGSCGYYEHVMVTVSRAYLRARTRQDIGLRLSGPGGEIAVTVPAGYVDGFLQRFDAEARARAEARSDSTSRRASFCEGKYGRDPKALGFCQREARASYGRLKPALSRMRADADSREARVLEACMRRHDGELGIDWMMVEHCVGRGLRSGGGPASH